MLATWLPVRGPGAAGSLGACARPGATWVPVWGLVLATWVPVRGLVLLVGPGAGNLGACAVPGAAGNLGACAGLGLVLLDVLGLVLLSLLPDAIWETERGLLLLVAGHLDALLRPPLPPTLAFPRRRCSFFFLPGFRAFVVVFCFVCVFVC